MSDVAPGTGSGGDGPPTARRPASGVVVREATGADADAMVRLRAVMFAAMGTDANRLAEPGWRRAAHRWFVEHADTAGVRVVVAEVDGEVCAGAVGEVTALIPGPATVNGSVGLISNVATFPEHRGRGLARAVTDDLLAWFEQRTDVTRVDLFATPEGARIYAARGFGVREFPAMCWAVPR